MAEHRSIFFHHYNQCLETQTKQTCELQLVRSTDGHPDNTFLWVQMESIAVEDEEGNLNHLKIAIMDITQRKQVEEELKKSEGVLRVITDNIPALVCLYRQKSNISFCQ